MNTKKVNTTSTVTVQKHTVNSCIGVKNNKKNVYKSCVYKPQTICLLWLLCKSDLNQVLFIWLCICGCPCVGGGLFGHLVPGYLPLLLSLQMDQ